MRNDLYTEWNNILGMSQSTPYVFRTRLERVIKQTMQYAQKEHQNDIYELAQEMLEKMQYISDQSNQTSDGCLNSYIVLKDDMMDIRERI